MTDQQRACLMALNYLDLARHRGLLLSCPTETRAAWFSDPRPAHLADACEQFEDGVVSAALGEPIAVSALPPAVAAHVRQVIRAAFNRYVIAR